MTRLLEKKSKPVIAPGIFSLLYLIVFSILFGSCSKEPGQIGHIIQPEDSKLKVFYSDSSTIYGYSEVLDSIRSDKLSVYAFGSLKDPVFGGTTAGFYTQFILSINGFDFGYERQLDSLVLRLAYEGYYGDTNIVLTAHTYEMLENIDKDLPYYSNLQVDLNSVDYSNFAFEPRPNGRVVIQEDTLPAVLQLNLTDINTSLGYKLLNIDSSYMTDSETFQDFFNGLFIQSQPVYNDGAIMYFGLSSAYSSMSLYYRSKQSDTATSEDTLRYDYLITSTTAAVNKYEHEYNTADQDFKNQVIFGDTLLGAQKFYVQGYGGIRSIIKTPHIREWAKLGSIAINEAKLVLPGYPEDEFFDAPTQMYLLEIGEDGLGIPLVDSEGGGYYFDGEYNESQDLYEFRITRYIQSLISDTTKPNRGLYLFIFGGSVHPERYIFNGNQPEADTTSGVRLELLYTDL